MTDYDIKNLPQDARLFATTEFGNFYLETIKQMQEGYLSAALNTNEVNPDRYLAKYSAAKEILSILDGELGDHTPLRG